MERIEFNVNQTSKIISFPTEVAEIQFEQFQSTQPLPFSSIIIEIVPVKNILFQMYINQVNRFVIPIAPWEEKWTKVTSRQMEVKINQQNNPWVKNYLQSGATLFLYYETR